MAAEEAPRSDEEVESDNEHEPMQAADQSHAAPVADNKAKDEEYEKLMRDEREAQARKDALHAASWSKQILTDGNGEVGVKGAVATLHLVGRLHSSKGAVFDDSRARDVPLLVILGRGVMVPGLDLALLSMKAGEKALIMVQPDGGYGAAGNIDFPRIPGSATLFYEVEMLKLEKELELWEMEFEEKMRKATLRRERGNTLFRGRYFKEADDEYEQGMRYLFFMPHPTEEEAVVLKRDVALMNLNLTASKLRCGHEKQAIKHGESVLATHPEHPKALYRLGQAYTQLGEYEQALRLLDRAETASASDAAMLSSVRKEKERLQSRKDRHARQRKQAFARMISGRGADGGGDGANASLLARIASRRDVIVAAACIIAGLVAMAVAAVLR